MAARALCTAWVLLLITACLPESARIQSPQRTTQDVTMPSRVASVGPVAPFAWADDRRLTWADFQGPQDLASGAAAMTAYAISMNTACEGGQLVSHVTSTFLPDVSWVRSSYLVNRRSDETLKHEQAHFDLSEVLVRRLRATLRELRSPCDEPDAVRASVYAKYQAQDAALQQQYDRETMHGTIGRQQQLWESRIRTWLRTLPE